MPKKGKTSKKKPSKKRGRGPKKKRKMMTLDKVKSRRGRKKKKAKRSKKKYKVPSDDEIIEALMEAHKVRPGRYTILGTGLEEKAARKIATVTGVIGHPRE